MKKEKEENIVRSLEREYWDSIKDFPVLEREEEKQLFLRLKNGQREVFETILKSNLRLVYSIAGRFYQGWKEHGRSQFHEEHLSIMDLVQEGNIALIKAIEKFDPSSEYKFSTYATPSVERQLIHFFQKVKKIQMNNQLDSLDAPVTADDENGMLLSEKVADEIEKSDSVESQVQDLLEEIEDETVKKVILLYFSKERGMQKEEKAIFTEVGEAMDITGERARQIATSYYGYKANHLNATEIGGFGIDLENAGTSPMRSGIGTNHTTDALFEVKKWMDFEYDHDGIKNWDMFYQMKDTTEFLQNLKCTAFYVYFVRYLMYQFENMIPQFQPEDILWEIQSEAQQTPGLNCLAACVAEECENNGYKKPSLKSIKKFITAEKVSEKGFFDFALKLNMSVEDVEELLKKALLREGLNIFDREEAILFIAFKYAKGNKKSFVEKALKMYDEAEPKKLWNREEEFNTRIYKNQMERLLDKIEEKMIVFDDAEEVLEALQTVLAHMKYVVEKGQYKRTANQKFLSLYNEFEKLISADRDKVIKPKNNSQMNEVRWAEGSVQIKYDCEKGLDIPKGARLMKQVEEPIYFEVLEEICEEPTPFFSVLVKVRCTEETEVLEEGKKSQEIGHAKNGTRFTSDLIYVRNAVNKSGFKANGKVGSKTYIEGNLVLVCDAQQCEINDTIIPQGTIFCANGFTYITVEDVRVCPCVAVKVGGALEAKQNEIQCMEGQEKYPQILGISHAKISYKKNKGPKRDVEKKRLSHQASGALSEYLYHTAGGSNINEGKLEHLDADGSLRRKLTYILEDTDIDCANKLTKIKKAENAKLAVKRSEILTMAFLVEMAREQFVEKKHVIGDPEERLAVRIQKINQILNECGFYGVYLANPYDSLLLYISTFRSEPIYVFRNLWGNLQDFAAEE